MYTLVRVKRSKLHQIANAIEVSSATRDYHVAMFTCSISVYLTCEMRPSTILIECIGRGSQAADHEKNKA